MQLLCQNCSTIKDSKHFNISSRAVTGFRRACMDCEAAYSTTGICEYCGGEFPKDKHSKKKYCCATCRKTAIKRQVPKVYIPSNMAILENKAGKVDRLKTCFRGSIRCMHYSNWMKELWCDCVGFKE